VRYPCPEKKYLLENLVKNDIFFYEKMKGLKIFFLIFSEEVIGFLCAALFIV
jgi:hypothetical protein